MILRYIYARQVAYDTLHVGPTNHDIITNRKKKISQPPGHPEYHAHTKDSGEMICLHIWRLAVAIISLLLPSDLGTCYYYITTSKSWYAYKVSFFFLTRDPTLRSARYGGTVSFMENHKIKTSFSVHTYTSTE
jgi:hypothetical protein